MDVSGMERVGGTDAGAYYRLAPDVLLAWPREGYIQTEEGARASLVEQHRIARDCGRRQVLVVLLDRVRSQDAGSRKVWANEVDPRLMCGLALVGSSALGRAIASFFLGLRRPRVPTAFFASPADAVAWATETLAAHGGEHEL